MTGPAAAGQRRASEAWPGTLAGARRGGVRSHPGEQGVATDASSVGEIADASSAALRLLGHRARTSAELARALAERGFSPGAVDAVVARFLEVGLLDDWAYAREWARSRQEGRGLSTGSIRRELLGKGVPPECIEAALAPCAANEEAAARGVLARSARRMSDLPSRVQARRLASALARKGFAPDLVMRLVREHVESIGAAAPLD